MKIFSIFLLVIFPLLGFGQEIFEINGTILDKQKKPIEYVAVIIKGTTIGNQTDINGKFKIEIPNPTEEVYTLVIQYLSFETKEILLYKSKGLKQNIELQINESANVLNVVDVIGDLNRDKASEISLPTRVIEGITGPNVSIESLLKLGSGVRGNELSNVYSVRGGSYDENLVYVNDFEIYRPQLQSSSQQEGLSFINPDLVGGITFSSGGFAAQYGDKLSSVLDVKYKQPTKFGGSFSASLLGITTHLEAATKDTALTILTGFRFRSNKYLFGNLDTKGQYAPNAFDFQTDINYRINRRTSIELLVNHATNKYNFAPQEQSTTTGAVNQVIRLSVFFEGTQNDFFQNTFGGIAIKNKFSERFGIKWLGSLWKLREEEKYNITGAYSLGEVESDFSKDNFGQVKNLLGYGVFQDWGRNTLEGLIGNGGFKGYNFFGEGKQLLEWGANFQYENINDGLSEWQRLDSAGYSIPYNGNTVTISSRLFSVNDLRSWRTNGYIQDTWNLSGDSNRISLTIGVRYNYWSINKEFNVSPRLQFSYKPNTKHDVVFRVATGWYTQPPFYREIRDFDGNLNKSVKSQKAFHFIAGSDLNFSAGENRFKFTSEVYYKFLKDINPYELQDVRIRYFADNIAKGYAAGVDLRLFGEFVKGTDSWVSLSYLQTKENLKNDFYKEYYNAEGQIVTPYIENQTITDSATIYPGSIPRPTDQRFSMSLFFQDYVPKAKFLKMSLGLTLGTALPFGPPDRNRYRDVFRAPPYRRVDIGFSAIIVDSERENAKKKGFSSKFDKIFLTFEVWNLLGVQNTVSYKWIKDFQNILWPLPNYLTNRRFNLKLNVKF
ncbi:MAG: TonB-dependent receptor [Bacteroidetes bacterium]|jgi:hypothetical protein|nr:TonB-dependent receptor [Bacteroidota bacterium]